MLRTLLPLLLLAPPAVAAGPTPRDRLLALVPADTAVCFLVQGLRDRAKAVAASPFADWAADRLRPVVTNAPEVEQLRQLDALFRTLLGVTLTDIRDDIIGDAVVLAYQPGPAGKPDAERGVILLKARDPVKLRALLDRLNTAQKGTEFDELAERTHRGRTYNQRVKAGRAGEFYFVRDDGVFAFAGQEEAIRAVIDREAGAGPNPPPVAADLDRLGVKDAFMVCWFGPRPLDTALAAHRDAASDKKQNAFREQFGRLWAAVDAFAIYLDVGTGLELGAAAAFRPDALPAELKPLLASSPVKSALWDVIPRDALFAVGGRVRLPELLDAVLSFLPTDERAKVRADLGKEIGPVFGKHKLPAVLAGLGPEWGGWATPPASGWVPTLTAAVRVRSDDPAVPGLVGRGASLLWQLVQIEHNRTHDDQLEITTEQGLTVMSGEKLPAGFRPAVGVKDGFLVAGSSPAAVTGFVAPKAGGTVSDEVPMLRLSAAAVRDYLRKHGEPLAAWVATAQDKPKDEVTKALKTVADILDGFERIEVIVRGDGSRLRVGLRVTPVKPLK